MWRQSITSVEDLVQLEKITSLFIVYVGMVCVHGTYIDAREQLLGLGYYYFFFFTPCKKDSGVIRHGGKHL